MDKSLSATPKKDLNTSLGLLIFEGTPFDYAHRYITEVLAHAKLPFIEISEEPHDLFKYTTIVIPGEQSLSNRTKTILRDYVSQGGILIGIGGTSGLDELFGATTSGYMESGYIKVIEEEHPLVGGIESSLHTFRITCLKTKNGRALAKLLDENHLDTGYDAILLNQYGKGLTILYGPDLVYSILHIQQGIDIRQDGTPAPDGSASIDDGILKTDDGIALNWEWDRNTIEDTKFFAYPITDELRELLLKGIFYAFSERGHGLPMVWYWKNGLQAVGLISHDSDGNIPNLADKLHDNLMDLDIKSTWCIQYPGGYSSEFYSKLKETGYEIALHYDAITSAFLPKTHVLYKDYTTWDHKNLKYQFEWLLKVTDISAIWSNKNHYLRWEGYLDFFRWLEEIGIQVDQSKGPSKGGNVGFIFGGSHPWFPMDEKTDTFINVLEINLATQDLVLVCPYIIGPLVIDQALKHAGIAHFLFHPNHVLKPGIADAMRDVVNYGKNKGMEWWTSKEINTWERGRRKIEFSHVVSSDENIDFKINIPLGMDGLTLRVMIPLAKNPTVVSINGKKTDWNITPYIGFNFIQFIVRVNGLLNVHIEF